MCKVIVRKISDIDEKDYLKICDELDDNHKKKIKNYDDTRLKQHLASLLMLQEENIDLKEIKYNENGKPIIDNINFSVSHCDEYVLLAISNKKVGIDIEKVKDYNPQLLKYLNMRNKTMSNKEFFIEYTKREALIKMLGLSLANININYNRCKYKIFYIDDYVISLCYEID